MAESSENSIQLPSLLTIRQVDQVYHQCEDALKGTGNLRINAADVSKVDTAGLQLLVALKVEMDKQHSSIEWISVPEELRHAAHFMGLANLFESATFS